MLEFEIKTLRDIPQVEKILSDEALAQFIRCLSQPLVARVVGEEVQRLRERLKSGQATNSAAFMSEIMIRLADLQRSLTTRVINATGIVVHTNLGRAPLGHEIFERLKERISGYSSLEYDLSRGERGSRGAFLFRMLAALTEAEAGLAVNNNAAAVMLILNTFALGKKCLISRGEQVQIGGGFRMREVALRSGANLTEVGASNRTVLEDYRDGIDSETTLLLKVHLSNYKLVGFTEEATLKELVALGRERRLLVVHDLGSGALLDTSAYGLTREPTIHDSLAAGVDLVCFSGDKLLGGPQAGIILGKRDLISALKENPLYRTLRLDKIVIAILEELILRYMKSAHDEIPLFKLLGTGLAELRARAANIQQKLTSGGVRCQVVDTEAYAGGGSLPEEVFPSVGLSLDAGGKPDALARKLRLGEPPLIGRISKERLILDVRTVFPPEDEQLTQAVLEAVKV